MYGMIVATQFWDRSISSQRPCLWFVPVSLQSSTHMHAVSWLSATHAMLELRSVLILCWAIGIAPMQHFSIMCSNPGLVPRLH